MIGLQSTADIEVILKQKTRIIESVERTKARYKAITEEFVAFPYGSGATITYDMWYNAAGVSEILQDQDDADRNDITDILDEMTDGGFSRLMRVFGNDEGGDKMFGHRTDADFTRVIDAMKRGMKSDLDETLDLDRFGQPNIARYTIGCRQTVSVPVDKVDEIDLASYVAPWHGTGPIDLPIFYDGDDSLTYDLDGCTWAILPYNMLWPWDRYTVLVNLCASGFEYAIRQEIQPVSHEPKRQRKARNVTTKNLVMPNDAVTNAFFARDSNAVEPWDYFNHETPDKALQIGTGGGRKGRKGEVGITILHDSGTTIDSAIETYRMTPEDRFWLEAICSLARDGHRVIRGSDLLKFNGYNNPYAKTMAETMERAFTSVRRMWRLRIGIDTTNELKGYRGLVASYDERPIVDCTWRLLKFDDGTSDFEIILHTDYDGTPIGALPLAVYATDKQQLLFAERSDLDFETIGRLTLDHRLMWRYVLRRIKDKKTSETIVFDTIFKNIGLKDMDRFKRSRMLSVLHKMLEERRSEGALTFTWNRDKNGRAEYSVTITPRATATQKR